MPDSLPGPRGRTALLLLLLLPWLPSALAATANLRLFPLPAEVRSTHFRVTVNGRSADVLHAASDYYLLNFDSDRAVTVTVTAADPHFWDHGVEVQPMRFGIRPVRHGATITFPMSADTKLVIARPGDHFADADMLFLFANLPEKRPDLAGIRYFGPGIHRENIDAHTGDRIYLDGGAVILGAVNLWQVRDIRIFGKGTVVYDGPQDPHSDQGWMHKPNWHCMVMDHAENIEVDGITCITRSRSWQIQMKDSRHIGLFNIKAIGGNPNDANQDGLDWLGGGDTTVQNSFFRASDDVFALQGNWEGYDLESLSRPGHDVTNITIQDTVASTSVSNTIRVGWPQKTFNSAHFVIRDVDVLHTGFGSCKVPFAFFELWADPDGHGRHEDYSFRNIRLEDWYSLFQIRQPAPQVRHISFEDIWAMDGPAMVPSVLKGDVEDISLAATTTQGFQQEAIATSLPVPSPSVRKGPIDPSFTYTSGLLHRGQTVSFLAAMNAPEWHCEWIFGDGSRASGSTAQHRFPDTRGTLLDGSGRFRVLLHLTRSTGEEAWSSQDLVLVKERNSESRIRLTTPAAATLPSKRTDDLSFDVPADGGYTFTLLTSTKASFSLDDLRPVLTPKARPQVCGSLGDAVLPVRQSVTLAKGPHTLHIDRDASLENAVLPSSPTQSAVVLWEGPGVSRQRLTPATHSRQLAGVPSPIFRGSQQ